MGGGGEIEIFDDLRSEKGLTVGGGVRGGGEEGGAGEGEPGRGGRKR